MPDLTNKQIEELMGIVRMTIGGIPQAQMLAAFDELLRMRKVLADIAKSRMPSMDMHHRLMDESRRCRRLEEPK